MSRPAGVATGVVATAMSAARAALGVFWLYFAQQKWGGIGWVQPLLQQAAQREPIPGLGALLSAVVVPNWVPFVVAQTAGETLAGILLLIGLATRAAAILASLLALNLALTVAFDLPDAGLRWMYYLAVIASVQVVAAGSGPVSLDRLVAGRRERQHRAPASA